MKSITIFFSLISIATVLTLSNLALGNEEYSEQYSEEDYQEEPYQEETYQEQTYQEEPSYEEPAYVEPEMDSYQANQIKEVKSMCQQWAQESGLEGEDKATYIEDCVYSQTGY